MPTFGDFTNGGVPDDASIVVGYESPSGSGKERLWAFANIYTYIKNKLFPSASLVASVSVPFLPTITAQNGSGSAGLDQIPTTSLAINITVFDYIDATLGASQRWQLIAYTGQSGIGFQLPADFNGTTNNKIWSLS